MASFLGAGTLSDMAQQPRRKIKRVWRKIFLREWREFRGFTVERLAELAKVSPGLISQIENRVSAGSPDTLERLSKVLNITAGELLDVQPQDGGFIMRAWVRERDRQRIQDIIAALSRQTD